VWCCWAPRIFKSSGWFLWVLYHQVWCFPIWLPIFFPPVYQFWTTTLKTRKHKWLFLFSFFLGKPSFNHLGKSFHNFWGQVFFLGFVPNNFLPSPLSPFILFSPLTFLFWVCFLCKSLCGAFFLRGPLNNPTRFPGVCVTPPPGKVRVGPRTPPFLISFPFFSDSLLPAPKGALGFVLCQVQVLRVPPVFVLLFFFPP